MNRRTVKIGLIAIAFIVVLMLLPDLTTFSNQCVLCAAEKRPNLCLIDLNTGEIDELMIYDVGLFSDDRKHYDSTEFSVEQTFGTFNFVNCVGVKGYRTTGAYNKCSLTIPDQIRSIQKRHYCRSCYECLSSVSQEGYILLDLYELENIGAYSLVDGDSHNIRCFDVYVVWDKEHGELNVDVCGRLKIVDGEQGRGTIVGYP